MAIKFEINMTNRWLYSLIAFAIILVLGVGVLAYTSDPFAGDPSVMGHSAGEIEDYTDNTILSTCQICVRYEDNNGRDINSPGVCGFLGEEVNTDFIGTVDSNDDFDLSISCSDSSVQNSYHLCVRHSDFNQRVFASWDCSDFGVWVYRFCRHC